MSFTRDSHPSQRFKFSARPRDERASAVSMQRHEMRFAAGHSDYSLLVVTLSPPITGAVTELYGLPLLGREGGFLLCIPHGVISPSMFEDVDAAEMAPTWLGVGVALEVPLVEEADDGTPVPLNAAGMVDVIDVTDDLLNFVRQYDPVVDSDIEVVPYHDEHPGCIPDLQALNQQVVAWITERQEASSGFYSAQEDPGSAPKAKQGAKKAAAPKRVTNAVLLEQMTVLSSQVQLLAARQDLLEQGNVPTSAIPAGGQQTGKTSKLPGVSGALGSEAGPPSTVAKSLALVGPPPKTKMSQMQLQQALAPLPPEEPNCLWEMESLHKES